MIAAAILMLIGGAGFWLGQPYWQAPFVVAAMSVTYAPFHGWVSSDRIGSNAPLSATIKLVLSIFGLVATLGFYACIGHFLWWTVQQF